MSISVDQLRLGVSFAHAVPTALLSIHLDRGRSLRCSHDASLAPELHPCQARTLLASACTGGPADWLAEVVGVSLGGPRLTDEGGGLYRSEVEDGSTWSFATTLSPPDAHDAVEQALAAAFAEHGLPDDEERVEALSALDLRAHIDRSLGVVVVNCPGTAPGALVPAATAARTALSACLVAELCEAVATERGLR